MDYKFLIGFSDKRGKIQIPYFGIYKRHFYEQKELNLITVPNQYCDSQYQGSDGWCRMVSQMTTYFGFNKLTPDGEWKNYHADLYSMGYEQLKEICPPIKYRTTEYDWILYSPPVISYRSITKTNPTSSQRDYLRNKFRNKTFTYYCLLAYQTLGKEFAYYNLTPTPEERPYLRDTFGGVMGIRFNSIYTEDATHITVSLSTTGISWD